MVAWWLVPVWIAAGFGILLFVLYCAAPLAWKILARKLDATYWPEDHDPAADPGPDQEQAAVPAVVVEPTGEYAVTFGPGRACHHGNLLVHVDGQYYAARPSAPGVRALELAGSPSTRQATDALGACTRHECTWRLPRDGTDLPVQTAICAYPDRPFLRFEITFPEGLPRAATGAFRAPVFHFPHFNLAGPNRRIFTYRVQVFAPPMKHLDHAVTQGPVVFYDNALNSLVLGATDHFMVGVTGRHGDGATLPRARAAPPTAPPTAPAEPADPVVFSGIEGLVEELPAGFQFSSLLFVTRGINRAVVDWCGLLREIHGVPARDPLADPFVANLGYWTDNGAYYYYKTEPGMNYAETLLHAARGFRARDVPIRYVQLDSWWYQKVPKEAWTRAPKKWFARLVKGLAKGGTRVWEPVPEYFPEGVAAFQKELDLPLAAHARWFSPETPYREEYTFDVGRFAAHPLDPAFWDFLMRRTREHGFGHYEQDWILTMFNNVPRLKCDVAAADEFFTGMGTAAAEHDLTIQYCMAPPGAFLYALKVPAVTNARTGGDYWARAPKEFFFPDNTQANILAWGVGIWPSYDVFYSTKTSVFQRQFLYREKHPTITALLSALGGGLVCPGDRAGNLNRPLLLQTCTPAGELLKPDRPVTPNDCMFKPHRKPHVLDTWTRRAGGAWEWRYVVAVNLWPRRIRDYALAPAEIGVTETGVAYDYFARTLTPVAPDTILRLPRGRTKYRYLVLCPWLRPGVAFVGCPDKFVTAARNLFPAIRVADDRLHVEVTYPAGHDLALLFYAKDAPVEVHWNAAAANPDETASGKTRTAGTPDVPPVTWSHDASTGALAVHTRPTVRARDVLSLRWT